MLPKPIERGIYEYFAKQDFLDFRLIKTNLAQRSAINHCAIIETNHSTYFVKWNNCHLFPRMFESEFRGLNLLREANEIRIAKPVFHVEKEDYGLLMVEFIKSKEKQPNFWEDFGRKLAELHQHTNAYFGLDHNNYIGSQVQFNNYSTNWAEFFVVNRIEIQLKKAIDSKIIDSGILQKFSKLYEKFDAIFPKENPSLLHGDLWNGNYITDNQGYSTLIDPSVYYGHREMDIAMTKLFGGFSDHFYASYHNTKPLESGWIERVDLCNLYPLLVHLNIFGGNYRLQIEQILKKFV
jgi:protein-ribulosamine 3-kinase